MTTEFQIKRASRTGVRPLIGLYSESGCGKTYSALLLARGLVGASGKIVMVDSESGRGSLYADVLPGGYETLELAGPFSPQRYIAAINAVEQSGAGIGILDSASHEWEGIGGVLDMASQIEAAKGKGLHCWAGPKMEHAKFMLRLLQSSIPWIVCLRAKYKTKQTKVNGRTEIVKDDFTTPIQADDFIFEMTCHAEILQNHSIILTKCSHPALRDCFPKDKTEPISTKHGELLAAWCANPGASPKPTQAGGGSPSPTASRSKAVAKEGTAEQRQRMFNSFAQAGLEESTVRAYAEQNGLLMPTEELGDWPLSRVPTTMSAMTSLIGEVQAWAEGVVPQ